MMDISSEEAGEIIRMEICVRTARYCKYIMGLSLEEFDALTQPEFDEIVARVLYQMSEELALEVKKNGSAQSL